MRQPAPILNRGHIMEVNFIIMKFMEWPNAERRRIYDAITSLDGEAIAKASLELLNLLTGADERELTQYANSVLGTKLSGYFIHDDKENLVSRAIWLYGQFSTSLKVREDNVFIDLIPDRK